MDNAKIIESLFWKLMERGGSQGIQFVIQIILARLLLPSEYGMIAIISVFIALANVFVQSGFNMALVQSKDVEEEDFSSVLYLSLAIAVLLYLLLFFGAVPIAAFYEMPKLVPVFRVLAINLIFGAFQSVQNAVISRNMLFKQLFKSSLGSSLVSGVVGIAMAYAGFGVWALVAQQVVNQLAIILILWLTMSWRPLRTFSLHRVRRLFNFGSKILLSSLLETFYTNVRSLIIGKIYTPSTLAYYNRGEQFPNFIVTNVDSSIQSVMLPALASHQDNRQRVKEMMRRSVVTSSFLIFPMMVGLAVVARPFVSLVLTDKWLPAVPFIQIFCFSYALRPIHTANLQAINALGYSDIFLKLEVIKKINGFLILLITLQFGVYAIALGAAVTSLIASFINAYPNRRLLNYSYQEQVRDISPSIGLSAMMGVVIYSLSLIEMPLLFSLLLQIFVGIVFYFTMAKLLKLECFEYLLNTLKNLLASRVKPAANRPTVNPTQEEKS